MLPTLAEIIGQLIDGWDEHIEYRERVHPSGVCLEKRVGAGSPPSVHPDCLTGMANRSEMRRQAPLLRQLVEAHYHVPVLARDCEASGGKPKSKPPGNLVEPDEILGELRVVAEDLVAEWGLEAAPVRTVPTGDLLRRLAAFEPYADPGRRTEAARALQAPWSRSRVALGYDSGWMVLEAVCKDCDMPLRVERSSPTVVECTGCDRRWSWQLWVAMLPAATARLDRCLVSTADAMIFTGRDRRVLYRWRREGRVTANGRPREPLWDVRELPVRTFDGTVPEPPPKRFAPTA